MKVLFTHTLLLILVSGCAPMNVEQVNLHSDFNANKAKDMLKKGNNSISGSALIRQKGGSVVTCAGNQVLLIPLTDYSRARMLAIYGNDKKGYNPAGYGKKIKIINDSQDYRKLHKETRCDAQGYFKFSDISEGSFFIITKIIWTVGNSMQGGHLMRQIDLSGGVNKDIVLSQ